jgi:hypothetical protein
LGQLEGGGQRRRLLQLEVLRQFPTAGTDAASAAVPSALCSTISSSSSQQHTLQQQRRHHHNKYHHNQLRLPGGPARKPIEQGKVGNCRRPSGALALYCLLSSLVASGRALKTDSNRTQGAQVAGSIVCEAVSSTLGGRTKCIGSGCACSSAPVGCLGALSRVAVSGHCESVR